MSESTDTDVGAIVWHDLTIKNAEQVSDFYAQVVGWKREPVSMGDYQDFNMNKPASSDCVAGICHARGGNAEQPAQWLMYVKVVDAAASARLCTELGGEILSGPNSMGSETYYTIKDPAGAVMVIYS